MAKDYEKEILTELVGRGYGVFIRRQDVQEILTVSKAEAYRLVKDGQLEAVKLKTRLRIRLQSVASYAAAGVMPNKPT